MFEKVYASRGVVARKSSDELQVEPGLEAVIAAQQGEVVDHLPDVLLEVELRVLGALVGPAEVRHAADREAGPAPDRAFVVRLWWRCAYWTRSSFSFVPPMLDTSCADVESIESRKSVDHCVELGVPPALDPMLFGESLRNMM